MRCVKAVWALACAFVLLSVGVATAHVPGRRGAAPQTIESPRPLALPAQQAADPPIVPTPRAKCGPGSHPEPGMQGRMPREEVDAGRADKGYWCNVSVLGQSG